MIRCLLFVLAFAFALSTPSVAQEQAKPFARVELGATELAVGEPVAVTVTLMVPTMFRIQPDFPDYDGINVIVRTDGPDMMPVNEFINWTRWYGSSQTYWIYPMKPGEFVFEAARATGTYTDPVKHTSATAEFEIESFAFTAVVPVGAEGLDPLIVADSLTLEQSWEGPVEGMKEGEAITRSVSATIGGSSALFLPALIPSQYPELVKAYPQRQDVSDSDLGKDAAGVRTESVTYVAQYGGEAALPDVAIRWFNSATGEIETAIAQGRTLVIDAPAKPEEPLLTRKQVIVLLGLLLCLIALVLAYQKWLHPAIKATFNTLHSRWNMSEPHAARKVVLAIRAHDLDEVFRCVLHWLERQKVTDFESRQMFVSALAGAGMERFGNGPEADWRRVEQSFRRMRKESKSDKRKRSSGALPELNPQGRLSI